VMTSIRASVTREGATVVALDGIKVVRPDGWVLLRPSGTEPLIRVFAEARDAGRARALAEDGLARVRAALAERTPSG